MICQNESIAEIWPPWGEKKGFGVKLEGLLGVGFRLFVTLGFQLLRK